MPGLQWPFVLAPLPPRRRKRVQPGFTDEELLYLEEILAIIDSMHESDDPQAHDSEPQLANHHTPARITPSRSSSFSSSSSSPAAASTSRLAVPTFRSRASEAKLWTFIPPPTVGVFLLFLATLLLSSHHGLVGSLLGAGFLGLGLKTLVASDDQALHLDPEHVTGKDRGRTRGRGRRSRRHTTSS